MKTQSPTNLVSFSFFDRTLRFVGTPDNPEWIAIDVCEALEISNVSQALNSLDDDEKNSICISDGIRGRGNPNLLTVNESGLYHLIFKSRKPIAQQFRRWVTGEVIPTIRKTGSYSSNSSSSATNLTLEKDSLLSKAVKYLLTSKTTHSRELVLKAKFLLDIYLED